jgi:hypothetical protein
METTMVRYYVAVIVAGIIVGSPAAAAADTAIDNEDSRFTFYRTSDGFLRLDGRSGQVSMCTKRAAGWVCAAVPDERSALEGEITRLQGENSVLKKELLTHNLPLPAGITADPPPARKGEPKVSLPSESDLTEMVSFMETVWKRVVEMVERAKRDMMK